MNWDLIFLCFTAMAAGAVNSVAGGGTLLTFPALMAVLTVKLGSEDQASVVANQTSSVALLPGSIAATWGYRRHLVHSKHWLRWLLPPSFVGGLVGALMLTEFPDKAFKSLVPWLILTAALLFTLQPQISRWVGVGKSDDPPSRGRIVGIVFFQLLVAIYGGYFGAGIGILMLSSLALMGLSDIHAMNALKNLLATTINTITIGVFMWRGDIDWTYVWPMLFSAIAGGYFGAAVAQRINRVIVRWIVVAIGFFLAVYYFYDQFASKA
jgi:uncharacterized membrane protein YfcA